MIQVPRAQGLHLCDQVLFEGGTNKPSLVGCFTGMAVDGFPSTPQRFDAFAVLTDGMGDVTMDLTVVRLETDSQIYAQSMEVTFPDPLRVLNLRFRVRTCSFPAAGSYLFQLSAGDTEIASCRLRVYTQESGT